MKIRPTPITAALAGAFAGIVMPLLWGRLGNDTTSLVIAFVLVVAVPAHVFVLGFDRDQAPRGRAMDAALFKRVAIWLLCAIVPPVATQAVPAMLWDC